MDRNPVVLQGSLDAGESPSSRRAWIEIFFDFIQPHIFTVALLAEGVDRNPVAKPQRKVPLVALLAEGVDRNEQTPRYYYDQRGRPPRGGRG